MPTAIKVVVYFRQMSLEKPLTLYLHILVRPHIFLNFLKDALLLITSVMNLYIKRTSQRVNFFLIWHDLANLSCPIYVEVPLVWSKIVLDRPSPRQLWSESEFFSYRLFFQIFRTSLVSLASHTSVLAFLLVTSLELKKQFVLFFKRKPLRQRATSQNRS